MNLLRIIVVTIVFTTFANRAFSVDRRFEACEPQTCGNGPHISYPFWLSGKQESCGYPSFKITCNEKHPVFSISDDDYIIREIFYSNHSFVLANAAVYDDKCPLPQHNLSLDRTPFNYSSDHVNFSFFYDCPEDPSEYMLSYPIDCASNGSHHSFATFHKELVERMNYSLDSCRSSVHLPFDGAANVDALMQMNYTEILKMGFILNWTAQNCSNCERSGGRCGFDDNEFVCFCSDRPHVKTCDDGTSVVKLSLLVVIEFFRKTAHSKDFFCSVCAYNNAWNWKRKVIVGVCTAVATVAIMCVIFFVYQRRNRKLNDPSSLVTRSILLSTYSMDDDMEKGSTYHGVHIFSYKELEEATNYFDSAKVLGDGGFGTVYHGNVRDGRAVAVKRLYENNFKRVEQFMNEIEILARLRHQNLVLLYAVDITRHRHEINLSTMAINKIQKHTLHELVDPYIGFESDSRTRKMIIAVAELAFRCLNSDKDLRPSMIEVLNELKRIQSDDFDIQKAEDIDISAIDIVPLKSDPLPASPDSVAFKWTSVSTTPNASG
ncbi:hypothetical protein C1H46_031431 [Malus baccata]|uniref:non-specific serine/threonine protein kinase n=1 Tax=Malus baccata TaxID=106549 RepID=A0A540L938_MALBA|nr:hypothetical protein C1H46_031431 [Malus baccata]